MPETERLQLGGLAMNVNNNGPRDLLIEQVASAWRPRNRDGVIQGHPAWFDLDEADRIAVYEVTVLLRQIEVALDPHGLSSTGHVVLQRIRGE